MRVNFEKVALHAAKSGVCPACGKTATRKQEFYQTLSPFNMNSKGERKSSREIVEELKVLVASWRLEPTYHRKCDQ